MHNQSDTDFKEKVTVTTPQQQTPIANSEKGIFNDINASEDDISVNIGEVADN